MAETGLTAVSALGGAAPYSQSWDGFSVCEATDRALVSIATRHGRDEALHAGLGTAPPAPGRWTRLDDRTFYWICPGQWIVEADGGGPALVDALGRAVGDAASMVDQSDAWIRLDLSGPRARAVLEKLCPLDLHTLAFPVGSVARTLMHHLGVSIALLDDNPRFALWVERSAARSFLHALVQAADSTCGPA